MHLIFYFLLFGISLISLNTLAIPVVWNIPTGQTREVTAFSTCRAVTNNITPAETLYAKTHSPAEWSTFYTTPPTGVSIANCAPSKIIVINGHSSILTSGSTNCTVAKPTSLAVGDLIITSLYESGSLGSITPPSGFTLIPGTTYGPICGSYRGFKHYKIATAADVLASDFTYTKGSNFSDCGLMLVTFRHVDTTTPIAASSTVIGTGTTINYPAATPTTLQSLSLLVGEACSGVPSTPGTHTFYVSNSNLNETFVGKILTSTGLPLSYTGATPSGGWTGTHIIINPN